MNPEKLAKLQEQVRLGGKGTPRRKVKKVSGSKTGENSAKLQAILKKVGTQALDTVDEVNMFCTDGRIIHFVNPKVQAAVSSNTFCITGTNKLMGKFGPLTT
jgi:nascent polypeptide-associated complex subunit beta